MKMTNTFYWAVLTACIWGLVPVLEKLGLSRIDTFSGLLLRSSGVLLGAIVLVTVKSEYLIKAVKADWMAIFFLLVSGLLASFVGQICFYRALRSGEVSKVVPIAGAYPLVSFLTGIIFLSEAITLTKLVGVLLILAGILLLR
jgi:transporter family protein